MNAIPEAFNESGVQLLLLITGWSVVALLVFAVVCIALEIFFDLGEVGFFLAVFAVCGAAVAAIIWGIAMFPFDGKYQHYYEVSGTVTAVSNVLSEADGELTRQPVVTLDSVDRPLVIDDPRAVSLLNQDVVLRCSIEWNYQAADSYSCRIVDFNTAAVTR